MNAGVDKPASVNPALEKNLEKFRKGKPSAENLFKGIREGNRTTLSQAITLVESTLPADQQMARELIQQCLPFSGNSFRLGITGVPGVGKSTFIEAAPATRAAYWATKPAWNCSAGVPMPSSDLRPVPEPWAAYPVKPAKP